MSAGRVFRRWAGFTRRDLNNGTIKPSEIDKWLRVTWDEDSEELKKDGVTSWAQFRDGVRAELGRERKAPAASKKKASKAKSITLPSKPHGKVKSFVRGLFGKVCRCR